MADLNNPMRFSIKLRTIDVENYLRHKDFSNKHVTKMKIEPGQLYVYWEEDEQ